MNQFETRCSSPRGFELSCYCTNHCFSTLARSNTRNGSTDTLQEAHPFVLVPHHPCSKTPDMINDHHKPPSLVIRRVKSMDPSLRPPFASASFLQTYHLSPLISYSGPTWQPCQKEVPTDLLSTCLICSIQTILHPTCSPTLVIAENPETRIRFFKTCSGGRSEIEHQ